MENNIPVQDAYQYALVRDGLVYLKPYLTFPERKIGEIKESEESSLRYFMNRFELARKKVTDLVKSIEEAQNKGSYLMKLIHLRDYLAQFDAIGDYIELFKILDVEEEKLREIITQNKKKNLEIKNALIIEAEQLVNSGDWKETSEKFKELRTKWVKTGGVEKEHEEEMEKKFTELIELFFARRKQFYEDKNQLINERVIKYQDIIRRAEEVLKTGDKSHDSRKKFKDLQAEWKAVGKVPQVKVAPLWSVFKKLNNQFFDKPGVQKPSPVAPWEELVVKAEELARSGGNDALKHIKNIQSQWQALGPIKQKGYFDLVERFKNSVSRVYEEDFINKTALRRFGLYFKKPEADQLKLKISLVNELIAKASAELKLIEENSQNVNASNQDQSFTKVLNSKIYSQKRKIEVMKKILDEHKTRLNEIKP